jgi:hypothetical protein
MIESHPETVHHDLLRRYCENESPKPINWTYTVQKLEAKLGIN